MLRSLKFWYLQQKQLSVTTDNVIIHCTGTNWQSPKLLFVSIVLHTVYSDSVIIQLMQSVLTVHQSDSEYCTISLYCSWLSNIKHADILMIINKTLNSYSSICVCNTEGPLLEVARCLWVPASPSSTSWARYFPGDGFVWFALPFRPAQLFFANSSQNRRPGSFTTEKWKKQQRY